jgi:hypothetical protein
MNQVSDKGPCQHHGPARSDAASVVICEDCENPVVSFSCLSVRMGPCGHSGRSWRRWSSPTGSWT